MTFPSPSRRAVIEVWQTRPDNSRGIQVHLVTPGRDLVVEEDRPEGLLYFVHVYWSPDGTKVGLTGGGFISLDLAYDIATGGRIPFDAVREGLAASIRGTYHLAPEQDPLKWGMRSEAHEAFFRLHPEIRLSYR